MRPGRAAVRVALATLSVVGAGVACAAGSVGTASARAYVTYTTGRFYGHVSIASLKGSYVHRLGGGGQSLISPNGRFVAVSLSKQSGPSLRIYRTGGGASANFYDISRNYAYPMAWSWDSRYLAVSLSNGLAVIDTTTMTSTRISRQYISGASFAPPGKSRTRDELVYGYAGSIRTHARVNLWMVDPNGSHKRRFTHNGRSLYPVWGRKGIVFDREHLRTHWAPQYQLWVRRGKRLRQLTHMHVSKLVEGLVPLGVSASGNRLLVEFEGQDTSNAWRLQLSPKRISPIRIKGTKYPVEGAAISRNGKRLLVDQGAFPGASANHGTVKSLDFFGGRVRKLAKGASPSWNK